MSKHAPWTLKLSQPSKHMGGRCQLWHSRHGRVAWFTSGGEEFLAKEILAKLNAFHSEDGREIKTEKIEEGLFWEMRDLLESVPKALASAESAGEFEGSASVQYEDGLAPNRQAEKARRYSVDFAEKARALLAKLED